MVLGAPQDGGVERAFVQIVESGVGGGRSDDLDAGGGEGVGQGQKPALGHAGGQDAQRRPFAAAGLQINAASGEGGAAQMEFFFGYRGAGHLLQPQRRLGGVGRQRHGQIRVHDGTARRADNHDRQTARLGRRPQPRHDVVGERIEIDHGGVQREVLQDSLGRRQVASGDGGPAEGVQPSHQRPEPTVLGRQDQYTRIESQVGRLPRTSQRP